MIMALMMMIWRQRLSDGAPARAAALPRPVPAARPAARAGCRRQSPGRVVDRSRAGDRAET